MSRNMQALEHAVSGLKNFLGEEEILALVFATLLLLKEKRAGYEKEHMPLEALKLDMRRLSAGFFATAEAASCAGELYYHRKNPRLSDQLLDHNLTESLLWALYESAQTENIPSLTEDAALHLSSVLPFLRQRMLPPALLELMTVLCGVLPKNAAVWDPYCGLGVLLSHVAGAHQVSGFGKERNRLALGFARVYYYLLTGGALSLLDAGQGMSSHPAQGYDAAVSVIPAGPYTAEEEDLRVPSSLRMTARYGEAARIWSVCDQLKEGASAVLLVPNGVLFRDGNDFALRKMLIENGWLDAVIYLPARVLFHTAVPSSILVIRKGAHRDGLRLLHPEEKPGWLQSGRINRFTVRAVREIPVLLGEAVPSAAELRLIPTAACDPANYRLDSQFYFGSRSAPESTEKTREALREELQQAEQDYCQAREELRTLLQAILPEQGKKGGDIE